MAIKALSLNFSNIMQSGLLNISIETTTTVLVQVKADLCKEYYEKISYQFMKIICAFIHMMCMNEFLVLTVEN